MRIRLYWPGPDLSPNARGHWSKLAKAKKKYRHECSWQAFEQKRGQYLPNGPLRLEVTFYRPTRRSYDRDNLLARMKSGLDGVCDALKIDDKRFETVVVRVSDEIGGFVEVEITEDTK